MKIASTSQIRETEDALINGGVSAAGLMEEAGAKIARLILREFGNRGLCIAYLGKGNNAGDALVVLRHLREKGWLIAVRKEYPVEEGTELFQRQWTTLGEVSEANPESWDYRNGPVVLLDGLVGLGATGALREPLDGLAGEMNSLRASGRAVVVAIDYPSGVDGDTGEPYGEAVVADISAVIALAKQGLLKDMATGHVGRIVPIPLPGLDVDLNGEGEVFDENMARTLLPPRPYEWFKGSAGRVSVIAGSVGMTGAARLCAESALRAGAGMVTLFALPDVYPLLAASVTPEVMVRPVKTYTEVFETHCDALLIGPGLGKPESEREEELLELIRSYLGKAVLDADALNLIARQGALSSLDANDLITPHVGEMERILPEFEGEGRRERVLRFMKKSPAALLFKGARTLIGQRGKSLRYNPTGGPAMATAGQGDVLSGVCAGLCAQGLDVHDAASLGAWLCGRASELALRDSQSEQSLIAGDTMRYLGAALRELRGLA